MKIENHTRVPTRGHLPNWCCYLHIKANPQFRKPFSFPVFSLFKMDNWFIIKMILEVQCIDVHRKAHCLFDLNRKCHHLCSIP